MIARPWLALAGVGVWGTTACLALPFAAPPTTVSLSPGIAAGKVQPATELASDTPDRPRGDMVLHGRAGVRPLGLLPSMAERRFGFMAGYVYELYPVAEQIVAHAKHGGFLAGTHYPWIGPVGASGWRGRLGVNAMADALYDNANGDIGGGLVFAVELEAFRHAAGDFAGFGPDGGVAGAAYGEVGASLIASGGVRGVGEGRYWLATLGVSFRLPAAAGVLLVPVWKLLDK